MNDLELRKSLYQEGWKKGLRSSELAQYIEERWKPEAAVAGPEDTVEEEAPVEEPKPKATKKKAKKKAAKK